MGDLLDQPAVVLLCVMIAAALLLVEAALPTFGIAGTTGLLAAIGAAVGINRQDAEWWPLLGTAAAIIVWALLILARRRSPVAEAAAIAAFAAGGLGFAAVNSDWASAALTIVGTVGLALAFPPLHGAATKVLDAPPQTGMESLVGQPAVVDRWADNGGVVLLGGTRWNAVGAAVADLHGGDRVTVVGLARQHARRSSPAANHQESFMNPLLAVGIAIVVLALLFLASSIKIVNEYERGVIFRLGRSQGAKGPGVFFVIPLIDRIVRTNLQIIAVPVASQAVITKDNVTATVDAVAYFQVVDPAASVINVRDWYSASQLVAQTTLRSIVGRHELDQLLSERERIDGELQVALDNQTEPWGVKVHRVEIRDVGVPAQMQRAMARQAEAERERRAKIIAADGELAASEKLAQAAAVIAAIAGRAAAPSAAVDGGDLRRELVHGDLPDPGRDPGEAQELSWLIASARATSPSVTTPPASWVERLIDTRFHEFDQSG